MTRAVVLGLGNEHRRDDGVGLAVARAVEGVVPQGVRVVKGLAEPTALLDAWEGAALAVIVDAAAGGPPGRVRRCLIDELAAVDAVSSHDLNLVQTYELGRALGRAPDTVVVITVDAADTGHGTGLSPEVAQAITRVVSLVHAELAAGLQGRRTGGHVQESPHQQS